MGGPRKYDPKVVEHQYVTTDVSLRALALEHGVSFSSLAAYARKEDWTGKRVAYKAALSRRTYEVMAAEAGDQRAVAHDESVKIARATLAVYAEMLAQRKVMITPKDAMEAVRTLAMLLGGQEGATRDDPVVINGSAKTVNADLLRRIADAARGQIATDGILAGAAGEEPSRTRLN